MKRVGNIMDKICSTDNILLAIRKASKGKKRSGVVRRIIGSKEHYANKIREMLLTDSYRPCEYITETIYDGTRKKERQIYKAKFYPDQIIHWAIVLQVDPIVKRGSYLYSCGNIKGRGPLFGKRYVQQNIRHKYKETKYNLSLDIHHFYPSVKPQLTMQLLNRKIKDKRVLGLLDKILNKEDQLPIGNLLSMCLSNFVLEGLDHYIKQSLRTKCYTRYVDDMMLFSPNKKILHKARRKIAYFLKKIGLKIKDNWQVSRTRDAFTFIGYRFYRFKTILTKQIMLRISRKVRRVSKKNSWNPHNCQSIISYLGIIRHVNCRGFYLKWVKPYLIPLKRMKQIIRRGQRQRAALQGA